MENLKSETLLLESQKLVSEEREIQAKFLKYLAEISRRRLYAELGYSTLFAMLREYYRYSEAAAYRRLSAMRFIQETPEAERALLDGTVNLSTLSKLQSFVQKEESSKEEKRELLDQIKEKSQKECEKLFATISPDYTNHYDQEKPVSESKTELRVVISNELLEKLEKIKNLAPDHSATYEELLSYMADLTLKKVDPAVGTSAGEVKGDPQSRYIPRALKRRVYQAGYKAGCRYEDPKTGRKCGSRFRLQCDHIIPFALGGETTFENLRLLCATHNRYEARKHFGEGRKKNRGSRSVNSGRIAKASAIE
jgi:hypothetical protein